MAIALMRHGQTDWNLSGRVQGHTNIPLNETGREQARQAAETLAAQGLSWSHITSSPLDRARETAQIVADRLRVALADPLTSLMEQNFGEAEGSTIAEFERRWPNRTFANGETSEQLAKRAFDTLEALHRTHEGAPVLAVTHGAYIRRLVATLHGIDYAHAPRIMNTSITTFERTHQGEWIITTLNSEPIEAETPPAETPTAAPAFVTLGAENAGFCTIDGVCN